MKKARKIIGIFLEKECIKIKIINETTPRIIM